MEKTLPHNHNNSLSEMEMQIPNPKSFDNASNLLKLIADGKRLQIFWLLCHYEECVINISAMLDITSPLTSHHLKVLKSAGLIDSRREGKEVFYTANKTSRTEILHEMIENIIEVTCPTDEVFEKISEYDGVAQTITEIHNFITSDLSKRHTIKELSLKFHINQTTLKMTFKRIYNMPIASYLKEYRIKESIKLLTTTDKCIYEISKLVGYESQSKFTESFKSVTGKLPKEYRSIRRYILNH